MCLLQFLLPHNKLSFFVSLFVVLFIIVSLYMGCNDEYDNLTLNLKTYVPQFIFASFFAVIMLSFTLRKISTQLLESLIKKLERNNEFKIILNNLGESIIVLSADSIEFVNNKFLEEFHDQISLFEIDDENLEAPTKNGPC